MKLYTLVTAITVAFWMMVLTINSLHHHHGHRQFSGSSSASIRHDRDRGRSLSTEEFAESVPQTDSGRLDFIETTEEQEAGWDLKKYNGKLPSIADHFGAREGLLSSGMRWKLVREAKPRVIYLENILSQEDCDALVDVGNKRIERSTVIEGNGSAVNEVRTSFGMFMQFQGERDHYANLKLRSNGGKAVGVPVTHIESTQLLRYYKGQFYKAHPDYFDNDDYTNLNRGGQRIATVLSWIHDCPEGGSTTFPLAGAEFKPRKGDAVLFYDADYDMKVDPYSSHQANPPIGESVKWVAVQWIHPIPFA